MERTSWKALFRIGGVALIVAGILYLVLVALLGRSGGLPSSGRDLLSALAAEPLLIQSAMVIFIVIDLCLTVAFPSLYLALKKVNNAWRQQAQVGCSRRDIPFMPLPLSILKGDFAIQMGEA